MKKHNHGGGLDFGQDGMVLGRAAVPETPCIPKSRGMHNGWRPRGIEQLVRT